MVITQSCMLVPWELKEKWKLWKQEMKMSLCFISSLLALFFCWLNSKRKQQHNLEFLLFNVPTALLIWYHSVYKAMFASVTPSCIPNKRLCIWRQISTKVNLRENNFLNTLFSFPLHFSHTELSSNQIILFYHTRLLNIT